MTEYVIIRKAALQAIQGRIEELEKDIRFYTKEGLKNEANQCLGAIDSLKQIIPQSTPLIPEIEKAWKESKNEITMRDYISNLRLDI